jgi:lipoprotein-anchoring transpeptidase ErfK/SrfK
VRWPALLALIALAGCGDGGSAAESSPKPAFTPVHEGPAAVPRPHGRYLTAHVRHRTWLRASPGGRVLRHVRPRTEFGSRQVLAVVDRRDGWLKVASSQLPNDRHGWIPESRAALGGTDYDIVVDRSARRATLRHDGRAVHSFSVSVGRPGNETPLGRFAVTDKLRPVDRTSPYGCCAVALTGHQPRLEPGWPGGDRLAIHGTPQPQTIGEAASLGCMRAPEPALKKLMRRVPLGAPVFVRA